MFARVLSLGVALGLSVLASLGFAPLSATHAASPGWAGNTIQPKRPQFRPSHRAEQPAAVGRWRPQLAPFARRAASEARRPFTAPIAGRGRQALFAGARNVTRKAVPVARGWGIQFRPEPGRPAQGGRTAPRSDSVAAIYAATAQSAFRPMRAKRKMTYEELQFARMSHKPAATSDPYPMMPGYVRIWPNW